MSKNANSSLSLQPSSFLPELKRLVTDLSEDLLARSTAKNDPYSAKVDSGLREAYAQIEKGGRTADAFEVWREDYLDQVAVAWVLACVFVRFMEDNQLIDECWLAGEGEQRKLAEDTHELYFREHPHDSDREYFEHVFHAVGKIPAARDLFAEGKTPLWAVGPSGDMAMRLLAFWREVVPETGELRRSFGFSVFGFQFSAGGKGTEHRKPNTEHQSPESDPTRFLGDLYQDLSERARKKYALLQTPVFVEEFILDRTLDPAIAEFGLDEVRMIDPTCGSGHFLLGGFARLFDLWIKRESNEVAAAQKALHGVWGCDINPFAVAIARFRLIVAALRACGIKRLKDAPAWKIHLATGDSLLFGKRWDREGNKKAEQQFLGTKEESWAPEIYACEDKEAISEVLGQQYHAVVGNPPYIVPKDKALNQAYRDRYPTCHRKYSLSVPFMERFFDLAVTGGTTTNGTNDTNSGDSQGSGYVGQITANSFMKREFGKKLIEDFFGKVDLTHVIDTSGAYIPGHGTPTVILFGRNRLPADGKVRAVLGIKGEPSTPVDPSQGLVWQSIVHHVDQANTQDAFTSVSDVSRATFTSHPWSIGGGGASDVMELIEENAPHKLSELIDLVGVFGMTNADEVFLADKTSFLRQHVEIDFIRQLQLGDEIRDWKAEEVNYSIFPYKANDSLVSLSETPHLHRWLWPCRTVLGNRATFGKGTYFSEGLPWWKWHQITLDRLKTPLSIAFAFVASHNHFVLDRGGKVFNRSAPIIKLPPEATEDDHLALLGLLNSSTACFWMKQTFHNKGDSTDQHGARTTGEPEFNTFEFTGTGLQRFPITKELPLAISKRLDELGQEYLSFLPDHVIQRGTPTASSLAEAKSRAHATRGQMIALQEELDWEVYRLFGLIHDDSTYSGEDLPPIEFGQRAFEISLAQRIETGATKTAWFRRHGIKPITAIPEHWPDAYRELVQRRITVLESANEIGLTEDGMYKRRWNTVPWDEQQLRALKNWLLDRLETNHYWPDAKHHEPRLQTVAELADKASGDGDFLQVAAIYRGREDFDVAALVAELVEAESVPFLPLLRYKPTGLRKREVWEQTWELQREEDRLSTTNQTNSTNAKGNPSEIREIPDIRGSQIPVPPKYTSADFLKSDYWRLRGKLDVPKERWISYPHCETASDPSLVVGWAGWNHLQQATALIAYYDARKRDGWDANRLMPLLAGLDQLLPWIHQWHPEIDPEFGETAGQSYQTLVKADAHELGLTIEQIRAWEPPKKTTTRRTRKT
jgi:hypothetical protein